MTSSVDLMLDCDLMRYRDSGLYHYCLNLGKALRPLAAEAGLEMGFYVPPAERSSFGDGLPVFPERSGWRSWWPPAFMRRCRVWHAPFQSGRIFPDRSRYPDCRVLLTIHDLNVLHEGKPAEEIRRSLAHTRSLLERADAVVCISEFCRQDVLRHAGPVNKPVYVIHNGTHEVGEPRLGAGSYRPQRPFLFGLGYVNRKKNYKVLLPLLENAGWELVIAGRLDEPDYVEAMRAEARQLGVEDRLHLTGPVSEEEKAWYLANCLGFVHPSLAEGFGAPVVEAMQFGKPLFLAHRTSLPEIAGEEAFYFHDFSPEHIRSVVEEGLICFGEEPRAERIRARGALYNWKEKARAYWAVYQTLL